MIPNVVYNEGSYLLPHARIRCGLCPGDDLLNARQRAELRSELARRALESGADSPFVNAADVEPDEDDEDGQYFWRRGRGRLTRTYGEGRGLRDPVRRA